MNIKKSICTLIGIIFLPVLTFAFEPISTTDLLMAYLENDTDLKTNVINAQKAQLSLDSTKISNGFDVSLTTGTVNLSVEDSGLKVSATPSVELKLPQASNLSVKGSTGIGYSSNGFSADSASIGLNVDIISKNGLVRKITLLNAERNLLEAQRKVKNQAINAEKAFYTELKSLLNSTSTIINSQKTLYTNKIDFEKIRTQGYSTGSSTYRLAQMKVTSTEHEIEQSTRSLIHSYVVFYSKCGYKISIDDDLDFYSLIPTDITEIEPLDIKTFDPNLYSEVESAVWTNKINSLERDSKSGFSLGAEADVSYTKAKTGSTENDYTKVTAGINSTIGGVTIGGGAGVKIADSISPDFYLKASISPNTFRQNSITEQTNALKEKQELMAIETAHQNLATKIIDCEQTLADLDWNKQSNAESLEMYEALEKDLAKWYKEGFITESEYYSAKVNVQSYTVKKIINTIDYIIYNDNIVTMFVDDLQEN